MTKPQRIPFRRALIAVTTLALAACQSTPITPPLLDLPLATATAAPTLDRWWTSFNDPTLGALINEALANNLDLQAAMLRVDLARSNLLLARSYLYPSMNLGADSSRNRQTLVGSQPLPASFNPTNNDYLVGLRTSYEVDLWGRYRDGASAARSELLATEYGRVTVRTAVVAETARSYFGLLAADAELRRRTRASARDAEVARRDGGVAKRSLPLGRHWGLRPAAGAGGERCGGGQCRARRTSGRDLRVGTGSDPWPFTQRSVRC